MRKFIDFCGFLFCKVDLDVWMRKATTHKGFEYWEFVLLYVDNLLVISHHGEDVLRNGIGMYFKLE